MLYEHNIIHRSIGGYNFIHILIALLISQCMIEKKY